MKKKIERSVIRHYATVMPEDEMIVLKDVLGISETMIALRTAAQFTIKNYLSTMAQG